MFGSLRLHTPPRSVRRIRLNGIEVDFVEENPQLKGTKEFSLAQHEANELRRAAFIQKGNCKIDIHQELFNDVEESSTDVNCSKQSWLLHVEVDYDLNEKMSGVEFYDSHPWLSTSSEYTCETRSRFCVLGAPHQSLTSNHIQASMGGGWLPCVDNRDRMHLWEVRITPVWNSTPLSRENAIGIGSGDFVSVLSFDSWPRRPHQISNDFAGGDNDVKEKFRSYVSRNRLPIPASAVGAVVGPFSTYKHGEHERAKDALHVYKGVTAISKNQTSGATEEMAVDVPTQANINFLLPQLPKSKGKMLLSTDDARQLKIYPPPDEEIFDLPSPDTLRPLATPHERKTVNRQREHEGPLPADFQYCLRFIERYTQIPLPSKEAYSVFVPSFHAPMSFKSASSLGLCSSGVTWGAHDCGCPEIAHMEGVAILASETLASSMNMETVLEQRRLQVLSALGHWFSTTGGGIVSPQSYSDEWLMKGLSGYISWKYLKAICGESEYQYQVFSANRNVCWLEEEYPSLPPICDIDKESNPALYGIARDPHYEKLLNLKSPLVCHCLAGLVGEARFEKAVQQCIMRVFYSRNQLKHAVLNTLHLSGYLSLPDISPQEVDDLLHSTVIAKAKPLHVSLKTIGVLPSSLDDVSDQQFLYKVAPSHIWSEHSLRPCFTLSTTNFLRELAQVCGATLHFPIRSFADQWIYNRGTSYLNAGWFFDRKNSKVELSVEQIVRPGEPLFHGELPIKIVEQGEDRVEETQVTGCRQILSLHCYKTKEKKVNEKRSMKAAGTIDGGHAAAVSGEDVNTTPVSWVAIDPNIRWIRRVSALMPAYMWKDMLEGDNNVICQLEAISAIANMTTRTYVPKQSGKRRRGKSTEGKYFSEEGISKPMQLKLLNTLFNVAVFYDLTRPHYFRVRAAAIEALVTWQNRRMPPAPLPSDPKVENGRIMSQLAWKKMIRLYKYMFFEKTNATFPLETRYQVAKGNKKQRAKKQKTSSASPTASASANTSVSASASASASATVLATSSAVSATATSTPSGSTEASTQQTASSKSQLAGQPEEKEKPNAQLAVQPDEKPNRITMIVQEASSDAALTTQRARYEVQKALLRSISRIRYSDGSTPKHIMKFLLAVAERTEFEHTDISIDSSVFCSILIDSLCRAYADAKKGNKKEESLGQATLFVKGLLARETLKFERRLSNDLEESIPENSTAELDGCTEGIIAATCLKGLSMLISKGIVDDDFISFDYYLRGIFPARVQAVAFESLVCLNLESISISHPPQWFVDSAHSNDVSQHLGPSSTQEKDQLVSWFLQVKDSLLYWIASFSNLVDVISTCHDDRLRTFYLLRLFELQKQTDANIRYSIPSIDFMPMKLQPSMSDEQLYEIKKQQHIFSFYVGLAGLSRSAAGLAAGVEEPASPFVPGSLHKIFGMYSNRPSARGNFFILGEPSVMLALRFLCRAPCLGTNCNRADIQGDAKDALACANRIVGKLENILVNRNSDFTSRQRRICFHFWHSIWGRNIPLTNVTYELHAQLSPDSRLLNALAEQRAITAWARRTNAQKALIEFQKEETEYESK